MMAQIANIAGYIREARDERNGSGNRRQVADTAQAAKMLNVSKRTCSVCAPTTVSVCGGTRKCRYRLSEILRLLEDNTVNERGRDTAGTLFHNHTLRTGGKPKGRRT